MAIVDLVFQVILVGLVFLVGQDSLELADTQEAVYLVTQAIQVVVYLDFLEHLALADIAE